MLTLIKGGQTYTPENKGVCDLLIGGAQILAMGPNLAAPAGYETEIVDASGFTVVPGYIDSHMHIIGAGGSEGPDSRTHEIDVTTLAKAGITTVVGTMGINTVSVNLRQLLTSAYALDKRGISTLIYTGGYQLPAKTLMESVLEDLSLIDKAVGVKIALLDSLCSHPSRETMMELASKVWLGGRLGFKAGLIHAHLGDTDGTLTYYADILKGMGLPPGMLVTTHVNRTAKVLAKAVDGGLAGLNLDITALYTPDNDLPLTVAPAQALRTLLEAGVPFESLTMSSDGNAAQPYKNKEGGLERIALTPVNAVAVEIAKAVLRDKVPLEQILPLATSNAANRLRISHKKGSLETGKDADIVLLNRNLEVDTVFARGTMMLRNKEPQVVGYFEKDYTKVSV